MTVKPVRQTRYFDCVQPRQRCCRGCTSLNMTPCVVKFFAANVPLNDKNTLQKCGEIRMTKPFLSKQAHFALKLTVFLLLNCIKN